MSRKYFTVGEADRTLPLVSRIVGDIVAEYRRWTDLLRRYEIVAAGSDGQAGETDAQVELRRELEQIAEQIDRYIDELQQIGCEFKGFEEGLVDFHSKWEGRDIYLCWKLGEEAVSHWHEIEDGYRGRQELVPEMIPGER